MKGVNSAGLTTILAAMLAVLLAPSTGVMPARADEVQDAANVMKYMSEDEIRAEWRRRNAEKRRAAPTSAGSAGAQCLSDCANQTGAGEESESGDQAPPSSARAMRPSASLEQFDDATVAEAFDLRTRGIYGKDDRREWYQVSNENIRRVAAATVAIFKGEHVAAGTPNAQLQAKSLHETFEVCPTQRYAAQMSGAHCSGTLVREDIVLTAGHCVGEKNPPAPKVSDLRFVFGYRVDKAGGLGPTEIPADHVFRGKKLLAAELDDETRQDWALVKLDRPVPASLAEPVSKWRNTPLAKGDKVYVIGYPNGLPLKYAGNARVVDSSDPVYFVTDLDTFQGNSGSAVFAADTNELVGVLVRGGTDYVYNEKKRCNVPFPCTLKTCNGEEVTRISVVKLQ